MPHLSRPELTLISGPVVEADGQERLYVGAYVPETVPSEERMKVHQCIGFLAVPDRDPTMYPQSYDGWVARPARADETTIEAVAKTVLGEAAYEKQSEPVDLFALKALIGKEAIFPPKKA